MNEMEEHGMDMKIHFPGGKKVTADFGGFKVMTDQPVAEGGAGSAPSPFDLFLASIVTCTGYYVLSFCQRNNIPTENMRLTTSIKRNQETHRVENVHIDIHVPKNFPEKYTNAVIKAAESCTVKKHLEYPPAIHVSVRKQ